MRYFYYLCLSMFTCFASLFAHATADGPDFYKINANHEVPLYADNSETAHVITYIPPHSDHLKNLGSFLLTPLDKTADDHNSIIWTKISYMSVIGWVQHAYLAEGEALTNPNFDCDSPNLHEAEALICGDNNLIYLDYEMNRTFELALTKAQNLNIDSDDAVHHLKATQRGWIKGRNDCWKASYKKACIEREYHHRISYLQVYWQLINENTTLSYSCNGQKIHTFTAHFYNNTPLVAVQIEYDGQKEAFIREISASGAKYTAPQGKLFWEKLDDAIFIWDANQPENQCIIAG